MSIILCRVRRGFILAAVQEEECCGVAGKVCCLGHVLPFVLVVVTVAFFSPCVAKIQLSRLKHFRQFFSVDFGVFFWQPWKMRNVAMSPEGCVCVSKFLLLS